MACLFAVVSALSRTSCTSSLVVQCAGVDEGGEVNLQAAPTLVKEPELTRERRRVNISAKPFSFRFHSLTRSLGKKPRRTGTKHFKKTPLQISKWLKGM